MNDGAGIGNPVPANRSVQELLEGSLELKDRFAEVLDVFERESARLSSIPSINPVSSQEAWVSSGFGYREDPISGSRRFHDGCDIVAPRGTPVIAPANGIVTFGGWRDGMGRMVEIEHGHGYTTTYGHNDKLLVKKGDLVNRGDLIAYVGSSGRSTGPHLHYEIRLNGRLVNPWKYLVQ
jgi:murein DD-endopeptidase MepM/ murein hydrolase activator NlpD